MVGTCTALRRLLLELLFLPDFNDVGHFGHHFLHYVVVGLLLGIDLVKRALLAGVLARLNLKEVSFLPTVKARIS